MYQHKDSEYFHYGLLKGGYLPLFYNQGIMRLCTISVSGKGEGLHFTCQVLTESLLMEMLSLFFI